MIIIRSVQKSMPQTQTEIGQIPPSDVSVATGFADEDIRRLGDRIAQLTSLQLSELRQYLEVLGYKV